MAVAAYSCEKDILCGVNLPKDVTHLTDMEKMHLPELDAPDKVRRGEKFQATVEIGTRLNHPNEAGHFIEWIELYSGDTFLYRVTLSGSLSYPRVTIPVTLAHAEGPLKAFAKCNLHGLWETKKSVIIED